MYEMTNVTSNFKRLLIKMYQLLQFYSKMVEIVRSFLWRSLHIFAFRSIVVLGGKVLMKPHCLQLI